MFARLPLPVLLLAFVAWASAGSITVRPGDTLWSLAREHGTDVDTLMAANGLARPDLRPGDVLVLPGSPSAQPDDATSAPRTWTVQPGDSLWAIAREIGLGVDTLMAANGLTSPDLRPGDVLVLAGTAQDVPADAAVAAPEADPTPAPAPATQVQEAPSAPASTAPASTAPASTAPETWTVEPGDTLYEIALRTDTSVSDLLAWNALSGSTIRPGDVLTLGPGGDATPALEPVTVVVGPGDSLWRIARLNDTTPAAIASANGMALDATLHPGDRLTIPGAYLQAGRSTDQGGFAAPTITVDPGDSLWEIARRYDTTVEALMAANGLNGSTLRAGQDLKIVAADGRSAPATPVAVAADPASAVASPAMVWPLRGPITSRFGWRALRIGGSNMHYGLDIDGQTGDPIVAATAGTVTYADWMGGFGKLVIIQQGDTEYYYAHASELLVRVGQQVAAGTLIARVGTTGRVTGSHLHFEIRVDGDALDPLPILEARAGTR